MNDKKKAAEAKARQAKKDEEKRRQAEERLLFHVVEDKKKSEPTEEDFMKSTKLMMEEYEYQSSVSALSKPVSGQAGSLEEEIEILRARIEEKDKLPVTAEWFMQWAEVYNAKLQRKDKKTKLSTARKSLTGKELFQQQAQGDFEDDEEAEEGWSERDEEDDNGNEERQSNDRDGECTRTASPASVDGECSGDQDQNKASKPNGVGKLGGNEGDKLAASLNAVHIN